MKKNNIFKYFFLKLKVILILVKIKLYFNSISMNVSLSSYFILIKS